MSKKKKKVGRPSKYDVKYCDKVIEFFSRSPNKEVVQEYGYKLLPNPLPFFSDFAYLIGVNVDTLHEWKKKHPEFSESYKRAQELQKQFLITNGLLGLYPTGSYCFTAKNITDMRDKQEIEETKIEKHLHFVKIDTKGLKDKDRRSLIDIVTGRGK